MRSNYGTAAVSLTLHCRPCFAARAPAFAPLSPGEGEPAQHACTARCNLCTAGALQALLANMQRVPAKTTQGTLMIPLAPMHDCA